jgi:hypothetical protein
LCREELARFTDQIRWSLVVLLVVVLVGVAELVTIT